MLLHDNLARELELAEQKAWDSLARYKFQMFGYWAAIWVHLNRVGQFKRPNPFKELVEIARGPHNLQPLAAGKLEELIKGGASP